MNAGGRFRSCFWLLTLYCKRVHSSLAFAMCGWDQERDGPTAGLIRCGLTTITSLASCFNLATLNRGMVSLIHPRATGSSRRWCDFPRGLPTQTSR